MKDTKYEVATRLHDAEMLSSCAVEDISQLKFKLRYSWLVRRKLMDFCKKHNGYSTKEIAKTALLNEHIIFAIKSHQGVDKVPLICMSQLSSCIDAIENKKYFDYEWVFIRPGDELSPWE